MVETAAERCSAMAQKMRAEMLYLAGYTVNEMHWGGAFSSAEIFAVLYSEILNVRNPGLSDTEKDKFILSKGHAAIGLYAAMHQAGLLTDEQIRTFQRDGSLVSEIMEACPEMGFEASGGSLGINPSYAVGLALLAKKEGYKYRTYVEVGDGELDEGAVWEAIMAASQFKLDNLVLIIDANGLQSDGYTKDIMNWDHLESRLKAFGWNTVSINGHDCEQLIDSFTNHFTQDVPLAVIANTVKGKGVSFMENNYAWHDRLLKGKELEAAKNEVGLNAEFGF